MDPDPGDPKTYRPGSATLEQTIAIIFTHLLATECRRWGKAEDGAGFRDPCSPHPDERFQFKHWIACGSGLIGSGSRPEFSKTKYSQNLSLKYLKKIISGQSISIIFFLGICSVNAAFWLSESRSGYNEQLSATLPCLSIVRIPHKLFFFDNKNSELHTSKT